MLGLKLNKNGHLSPIEVLDGKGFNTITQMPKEKHIHKSDTSMVNMHCNIPQKIFKKLNTALVL